MCTVVFIPGKEKYHFASLRDEHPGRQAAIAPSFINSEKGSYIAPVDPSGGGTWVGANEFGNVIILLNGGFKNHTKGTSYAKSRGIIVTELLKDHLPVVEWNLMNLDNIEPFTLIVWSEEHLFQLVWDGSQKHRINLSKHEAHIWSSSTLYSADATNKRTALFNQWIITVPDISKDSLLKFFDEYDDKYDGFLINRNEKVKTLSYTFITLQNDNSATISYLDFSSETQHHSTITVSTREQCCLTNF